MFIWFRYTAIHWRTLALRSCLTLSILLLSQHQAFAYPLVQATSGAVVLEPICLVTGFFAGSLLVVESRQVSTFLLNLMAILGVGVALSLLSPWGLLPGIQHLILPIAVGLSLGLVLSGLWWWGYRQAYGQALWNILTKQHQNEAQTRLPEENAGFFKTIALRARKIRYQRLVNSGEVNTLYTVVRRQIQQDWQAYQNSHQTKQKAKNLQQIQALLTKADQACGQTSFVSTTAESSKSENPL